MADEKITQIQETSAIVDEDLFVTVQNVSTTPVTRGKTGTKVRSWVGEPNNYLVNGGFEFAQRQTPGTYTTIAIDTYSADRWRISRENADLQYARVDALGQTGLSSRYFGVFKKITNTGKMVLYQILEGSNSVPLRGKTVIFQVKMTASAAKTIRMAVIELQNAGTLNTIPGTFVTAYGANTVDPTLGANLAIITSAQSKSVTTAWQTFSVSVTVPSDSKNLICALWTDSQFAANDILYVAEAGLYVGNALRPWVPRLFSQELALCQRHYFKTFPVDTAPAQSGGATHVHRWVAVVAAATVQRPPPLYFPVQMFAVPAITYFNPSAANAQARDLTAVADCSSTASAAVSAFHVMVNATGPAGSAVGNAHAVALTAEAEL
jgi:hypothetical protein